MSPTRDARHLRLSWIGTPAPTVSAPLPARVTVRSFESAETAQLGRLIWLAFRGTPDDEYASLKGAVDEAAATLGGKWGPMIWEASLVGEAGGRPIAAVVVVRDAAHELRPLLAFAVTEPAWQGRGVGRRLIEEAITRLALIGIDELNLAVTTGNPAMRLYRRVGFRDVTDEATRRLC